MRSVPLLALTLALGACSRPDAPPPVQAAKAEPATGAKTPQQVNLDAKMLAQANLRIEPVSRTAAARRIEANGRITVNENRTWRVGAITDGKVIETKGNPGDPVIADQWLAGMHSHDIHEARAEFRKATGELARLKSVLSFSQRQRDRYRRLHELKAASLEQLDHAETELKNAQSAVANAEVELERTRRHLTEFLQVAIDEHEEHKEGEIEHEGDMIPVRAPAPGTILKRNVSAGSVATAGEELFVIADLRTLWMIANVQEEFLGFLRIGMPVTVRVQAYPQLVFPGRIARLGEQLDPETRTVQVRVELANSGGRLKPEMYATAEIAAGSGPESLRIPQEALQQIEGRPSVFVETAPGRFVLRAVETGPAAAGDVEVIRGLSGGERIVVQGSYILKSQLLKEEE